MVLMKWSIKDVEKPWIAQYIKESLTKPGDCYPIFKMKESDKGGLYMEVEEFKAYLFPESKACKALKSYLEENHDKQIEGIQIEITDYYPYFELNDETGSYVEVHYQDNGTITLTPIPNSELEHASKAQVKVGGKKRQKGA